MTEEMFILQQDLEEKKDITIRGVNKALYNAFTAYSKKQGLSAGEAFNVITTISLQQPWRAHSFRRHKPPIRMGIKPEIISNMEQLVVTKKDLTAAGEKTMFLFRNIRKLVFTEDIDPQTLLKHVKMIQKSNVTFPKDIPKIIQLGLTFKKPFYKHPTNKEELKDITIRNVSVQLYDELLSKAKEQNKKTGELFSEILAHNLSVFEISEEVHSLGGREFLIISYEESLTVSRKDLEMLGERGVFFYKIKRLVFIKDVTPELFLKSILKIVKCQEVILPTNIPRLIVLSRVVDCLKTNIT
ncbi:MAG: hypothetical protein ACTSXO_05165 [Candidatus Heimdallarchaeota archaeon]